MQLGARFMLRKPFETDTVRRAISPVMRDLEAKGAVAAKRKQFIEEIKGLKEQNVTLQKRFANPES